MTLSVDYPLLLLLLPLALLPAMTSMFALSAYPSISVVPQDWASWAMDIGLRLAAALAILAIVLGLAGLHRLAQQVERTGHGAHIVLLLDRSSSMDNSFAGRRPTGDEESKSSAARRLLTDFIGRRPHDRVGIAAFSTSPMLVLPITDHRAAVQAAVAAIDRPGLAHTDVGRGLALALSMFDAGTPGESRAIVLVSDGAAVIGRQVQAALRDAVARNPVHLYWLFLRTKGSRGIFDEPQQPGENTPQAMPERHLNLFLASLGVPYRAFEATTPGAVEAAIVEIDKQEVRTIGYLERIPRRDLAASAYGLAAFCVVLLLLAKLAERQIQGPSTRGLPASMRRSST